MRVAWSRRQSFASVGAVLNLLDGPSGCDPAFCVVWFRFRMLRRYLAYHPGEVFRVNRLLGRSAGGLSVLPVVYRIWASARMGQLEGWFRSWVPDSVFSAGVGRSCVEA